MCVDILKNYVFNAIMISEGYMNDKILRVFYGSAGLPYKDQERSVHFPVIGNEFQGSSDYTRIYFYYEMYCQDNATIVATAKLPNGKMGSKILESTEDQELGEKYAVLPLGGFFTQAKGDVFISLQAYVGGVNVEYDESSSTYEIHGTPIIGATGSIKLYISHTPQFVGSGEVDNVTLQDVLASIGGKANKINSVIVVDDILNEVLQGYENGQLFYSLADLKYFILDDGETELVNGIGSLTPSITILRKEGTNSFTVQQAYDMFGKNSFAYKQGGKEYIVTIEPNGISAFSVCGLDINGMAFYRKQYSYGSDNLVSILGSIQYKIDIGGEYSNLGGLAEEYIPVERVYQKNEVVLYNGLFYRCIATTSGEWDGTKWSSLDLSYILELATPDAELNINSDKSISNKAVTTALNGKVDKTTTVNNKQLSTNISLDATDIGMSAISTNDIDNLFN